MSLLFRSKLSLCARPGHLWTFVLCFRVCPLCPGWPQQPLPSPTPCSAQGTEHLLQTELLILSAQISFPLPLVSSTKTLTSWYWFNTEYMYLVSFSVFKILAKNYLGVLLHDKILYRTPTFHNLINSSWVNLSSAFLFLFFILFIVEHPVSLENILQV